MPRRGLTELLDAAREGRYGLLAFNVIPLEYAEAVVAAAEAAQAPVVLQLSEHTIAYHGGRIEPLGRACLALADGSAVPVAVHLDHATTLERCVEAADVGLASVMFDASDRPDDENLAETTRVVAWAHARGVAVEAEIGIVGGKDGRHEVAALTEPEPAAAFVATTGVDALAVQVGTSHAMTDRTASLDLDRIARLHAAVPVPLVLHGSSGVPDEQLAAAVAAGLTKINVGTRLNVAFTDAVRRRLTDDPGLVDPRPTIASGRSAVEDAAAALLLAVGAGGRAADA